MCTKKFLVMVLLLWIAISLVAQSGRVALVIGNSNYQQFSNLPYDKNDAEDVELALKKLKFDVTKKLDASQDEMLALILELGEKSVGKEIAFFYFSGHGFQMEGQNYLVSVDSKASSVMTLKRNITAQDVLDSMQAQSKIMVLDACRNVPELSKAIKGTKNTSVKTGLGEMSGNDNTMIIFATSPGSVAMGESPNGRNSLFTMAFLKYIDKENTPLSVCMQHVTAEMRRVSKGKQKPWTTSSLESSVILNEKKETATTGTTSIDSSNDLEIQKMRQEAEKLKAYLRELELQKQREELARLQRMKEEAERKESQRKEAERLAKENAGGIPSDVWNNSRYQLNGEWILDMSTPTWSYLSVSQQKEYMVKYRQWYANRKGLQIEISKNMGGTTFTYCLIPPGKFKMGSPSNEPGRFDNEVQHDVVISAHYYIGKYEVTQSQWQTVMGNNPSYLKNAGGNAPVESVSWDDCKSFLDRTNQRFPTEAEWEYACRAGVLGMSYEGNFEIKGSVNSSNNAPGVDGIAWYGGNSGVTYNGGYDSSGWPEKQYSHSLAGTHSIGQKQPNAFGIYDMLGNVWEWCEDWYGDYPSNIVIDYKGPSTGSSRVFRGSSWNLDARSIRCASRVRYAPVYRFNCLGFRGVCVRP